MIIHLSNKRFREILEQGWMFARDVESSGVCLTGPDQNEYHVLNSEHDICETCGKEVDSIPASSPRDVEMYKTLALITGAGPFSTQELQNMFDGNVKSVAPDVQAVIDSILDDAN